MTALTMKHRFLVAATFVTFSAACGDVARQSRSPVLLVIDALEARSGAEGTSGTFTAALRSDVITVVRGSPTVFDDPARVTMRLVSKDALTTPSTLNAVTIRRYRVTFRRSDGRNTPGVDVPHPFDSAVTFTVPPGTAAQQGFFLVRHVAKGDAPLAALAFNTAVTISTVADVMFFGEDLAGNTLTATGSITVIFGDFGDPQ